MLDASSDKCQTTVADKGEPWVTHERLHEYPGSQRADQTADTGLRVAVRLGLPNAYFNDGRLRECLATAEEGLRLAQGDLSVGADRSGMSPSLHLSCWHGAALIATGRPCDGAAELDRVIELARASRQLTPLFVSHTNHVFRCEITGEVASALAHGREAADCAERTGSHLARIYARLTLGRANALNRAWHDVLEALEESLAIGRERRLLLAEGGVLSVMAAAHLGLGDRAKALATAEEAIAVCRRRGTRFYEFSALLTRIRALREIRGLQATREIEAALAEADAWLEMSGAKRHPASTFRWSCGVEEGGVSVASGVVGDAVAPAAPEDAGPGAGEDADGVRVVAAAQAGAAVDVSGPRGLVTGVVREAGESAPQAFVAGITEGHAAVLAGFEGDRSDAGLGGELLVAGEAGAIVAEFGEYLCCVDATGAGEGHHDGAVTVLRDGMFDGGGELLDLSNEGLEYAHQRPDEQALGLALRIRQRSRSERVRSRSRSSAAGRRPQ